MDQGGVPARLSRWGVLVALSVALGGCASTEPEPLVVAAASDLMLAFEELGPAFEAETGIPVRFSFGSSGALTQQLLHGAPVDAFFAANLAYLETLSRAGIIEQESVQVYAFGRLVLWTRAQTLLASLADLLRPEVRRVALANPEHAPYGVAARQALVRAGLWEALQPKLVLTEHVRQALQYAETGNAEAALVALSLVVETRGRRLPVDEGLYDPIRQAAGLVRGRPRHEAARRFLAFVRGPQGRAVLARYGFTLP